MSQFFIFSGLTLTSLFFAGCKDDDGPTIESIIRKNCNETYWPAVEECVSIFLYPRSQDCYAMGKLCIISVDDQCFGPIDTVCSEEHCSAIDNSADRLKNAYAKMKDTCGVWPPPPTNNTITE